MPDADYEEFGDTFAWKDDNGYVPGPGRHCSNQIVSAIAWIWVTVAVVVGA